jgi:DNA-directed RNA polymerase subunit M/transcription elongation factor TFIIS
MPASRPYSQKGIFELEELYAGSQDNLAELKRLQAELRHRKVPRAVALAKKVSESLTALKHEAQNEQPQPPNEPPLGSTPTHTIISCQKCGQGLRIELNQEQRALRCPTCKASFTTAYKDGVLSVVFEGTKPDSGKTQNEQPLIMTLGDAYQLFNSDNATEWEEIELTRRRLIQQYHPDKVAALGPKLRDLAEMEVKRINIAFDLLRKEKRL